ncbi:MAG: F0F1 ATP synthase subunit B [Gammaproteobacteria bacterium]|nr:F0F1 ATP synthase subunit B [Gammaproteobacteria bacterium]
MVNFWTVIGISVAFAAFVLICRAYIWPPLINAMHARQERIAQGLENAEKAEEALAKSNADAEVLLRDARAEGQRIIEQARTQATMVVEESKDQAREEGERILTSARAEITQEINRARESLRQEVAYLAVVGASRILSSEIDRRKHAAMLDNLVQEL